jgi:hypothetical protein
MLPSVSVALHDSAPVRRATSLGGAMLPGFLHRAPVLGGAMLPGALHGVTCREAQCSQAFATSPGCGAFCMIGSVHVWEAQCSQDPRTVG